MGTFVFRIISFPVRLIAWIYRILRLFFLRVIGRGNAATVRKSGGNLIASSQYDRDEQHDPVITGPASTTPLANNLFFRKLERPRLIERTGADLSLEEARFEVRQAERFFTFSFSLFPRGDFFYEEVEQEFLHQALGRDHGARDARFIEIMNQFRRILNDNSRRLFLYYTPVIFLTTLLVITGFMIVEPFSGPPAALALPGIPESVVYTLIMSFLCLTAGLLGLALLYHWPYKVTQQKNLLGLDNYITSKFARVNQNFLVAKRRSLNVERNKRMSQAEELRDEAGIWTLAYQWFALRLFFCETLVRNKAYQIRRNTTLYSVGGVMLCLALSLPVAALTATGAASSPLLFIATITGCTLIFVTFAYSLIMGRAARETINVLHANEWSRFSQMDLHRSIADHVAEDKLQIVTFRDRNRFE